MEEEDGGKPEAEEEGAEGAERGEEGAGGTEEVEDEEADEEGAEEAARCEEEAGGAKEAEEEGEEAEEEPQRVKNAAEVARRKESARRKGECAQEVCEGGTGACVTRVPVAGLVSSPDEEAGSAHANDGGSDDADRSLDADSDDFTSRAGNTTPGLGFWFRVLV